MLFIFSLMISLSLVLKVFILKGTLAFMIIEVMMWLVFFLAWSQKTREDRLRRLAGFCFIMIGIFWVIDNFLIHNIPIQNLLFSTPIPFLIMGTTLFLTKTVRRKSV